MTISPNTLSVTLGVIAVVGVLVCFGSIVRLHLFPTGYDPLQHAISDYGVGKYRFWFNLEVITLALVGIAMAVASAGAIRPEPLRVIGSLVAFGVARNLLVFFPTDIEGRPPTRIGRIHLLLAGVSFACVASAAGMFYGTTLDAILGRVVIATAVLSLAGLMWSRLRSLFGLLERLFYFAMISWFFVIGIELIRLSL